MTTQELQITTSAISIFLVIIFGVWIIVKTSK